MFYTVRIGLNSFSKLAKNASYLIQSRNCSNTQILQKFDSNGKININLNNYKSIKILPFDLLDCPDNNLLGIQFFNENNEIISSDSLKSFNLHLSKNTADLTDSVTKNASVILKVPVTSDINVQSNVANVSIENLQNSNIFVNLGSDGKVELKNIKTQNLVGITQDGNITTKKLVLGANVYLSSGGFGNISLDRMQGENLHVATTNGNINIESSYSTNSNFSSANGSMSLKNIHKNCKVFAGPESDSLDMNGFYGNLEAKICSKQVKLQLSELVGRSRIFSTNSSKFTIGLAETISTSTFLRIKSTGQINAAKIPNCKTTSQEKLNFLETAGEEKDFSSQLEIECDNCGSIDFEIKSWIDSLDFKKYQQVEFGLMWNFL